MMCLHELNLNAIRNGQKPSSFKLNFDEWDSVKYSKQSNLQLLSNIRIESAFMKKKFLEFFSPEALYDQAKDGMSNSSHDFSNLKQISNENKQLKL